MRMSSANFRDVTGTYHGAPACLHPQACLLRARKDAKASSLLCMELILPLWPTGDEHEPMDNDAERLRSRVHRMVIRGVITLCHRMQRTRGPAHHAHQTGLMRKCKPMRLKTKHFRSWTR
eukprot:TRINITY_DN67595_c0_g1_i1.p2 TRINITY_DN67595_c0_g1~~TRINITY_DN67595_c0_g1_i1.p2  ORF type:complete len:120 (+),score=3.46 TRINITY_DN67595_c0_g1_i1:31-390(+)